MMMTVVYGICAIITFASIIYMALKNYDNIDILCWTILILDPIIMVGYLLQTVVYTVEGSLITMSLTLLDISFVIPLAFFGLIRTVKGVISTKAKMIIYSLATFHFLMIGHCVIKRLIESRVDNVFIGGGYSLPGLLQGFIVPHYIYIVLFTIGFFAFLFAGGKRYYGKYSMRTTIVYVVMSFTRFISYQLFGVFHLRYPIVPVAIAVSQVLLVLDYDHAHSHDISALVAKQHSHEASRGFFAIDFKRRFLGCNKRCVDFLPFLEEIKIDEEIVVNNELKRRLMLVVDSLEHGDPRPSELEIGNNVYECTATYFSIRKSEKSQGYLISVNDVTSEKKNLEILTDYNSTLNEEVAQKTTSIENIQRRVVLGLADMIENRDDTTGGHVKRTSDTMRLIIKEIRKLGLYGLSEEKADDIVRAAPMHDLGKLHIDPNIFMKPGKLTDEEYALVKEHPAKSGSMVKQLLNGVENDDFIETAFNLARYHHERWDGRGYPEGLVGEMIPVEGRIMAVADVYDALVTVRCYKPPVDFEEAASIMLDCMGTQFDPNMKQVFVNCREKLEDYYKDYRHDIKQN